MRGMRLWYILGCLGSLTFFASAFTPLPSLLDRWSRVPSDIQPADAIVVLGSVVSADGTLSCDSLQRAIRGVVLQREGIAPLVVFSGVSFEGGASEAEVRAKLARTLGVPSDAILTEAQAFTTREEAARIGRTLRDRQVTRILLVTDGLHMRRAGRLFERVGLQVQPAAADSFFGVEASPEGRLRLMRALLGEWLALVYYRGAGYL
jgi:uncharacterized SAM-binding protein YcdF (DUF218 family)